MEKPQRPAPLEPLEEARDHRTPVWPEVGTILLILIGTALGAIFGWLELLAKAHP